MGRSSPTPICILFSQDKCQLPSANPVAVCTHIRRKTHPSTPVHLNGAQAFLIRPRLGWQGTSACIRKCWKPFSNTHSLHDCHHHHHHHFMQGCPGSFLHQSQDKNVPQQVSCSSSSCTGKALQEGLLRPEAV